MPCTSSAPGSSGRRAGADWRTIYGVSLLAGSLGALILSPNSLTAGASGAIYGLMGAFFAAGRTQGISVRQSPLFGILLLNLLLTFGLGGLSIGGHLGGLAGGVLSGWVLFDWAPKRQLPPARALRRVCGHRRGVRRWVSPRGERTRDPLIAATASGRLDQLLQCAEIALPDESQHPTADEAAHRATHPPREHEALFPGEAGAISIQRGEREPALRR